MRERIAAESGSVISALPAHIGEDLERLAPGQDVLAKVLAELLRLSSFYVQCLSALPLRLLLVDKERRVLAASELCLEEVLRARREDVIEHYLPEVLGLGGNGDDDREQLAELMKLEAALAGGKPWRGRLGGRSLDIQPLYTYEEKAVLLLFDNADKPAKSQEKLAQLEKSDRLVQMGQLSGGVAHELKNAMQNIAGVVQILQFKYMQEEELQRYLQMVLEELAEGNRLLHGFLGLSRTDMQAGLESLNQAVREALLLAYGSCRIEGICIEEELAEDLPPVYMDKNRIKQVVINCLDNSREAILAKRSQGNAAGQISIATRYDREAEQLVLTIADDGVGLGPQERANFFRPFYTTKEQGSGMGTSISAAIVRMHGGRMEAAGEPGVGSCITVRLPLHNPKPVDKQDFYAEMAQELSLE